MALDDRQILNFVGNELKQAAGGNENDFIDANRQQALATYLGQPDGKEVDGRSKIVSTDVADAIEWIMPEIVKAFTQNNDIVTFDACYAGDEDQANLESQYTYDILMKDNNGFLVLHQFIKDALMQKNGFIKVFYSDDITYKTEAYSGLTGDGLIAIMSDPDIEIIEQTTEIINDEFPVHDVKVRREYSKGKINVVSVPPEEFRVNKQHNSVDLSNCRFSAHVLLKTAGDLVEEGYSKELVDSIPSSNTYEDDREYRFYMQDETVYPDRNNSLDPSQRTIEIAECYMYMDADEDGIAEMVKVEVAGGDNPDVLLNIEEIDTNPFISSTAILMSHKLFGLSIYDRLKQIQEQKTTLWRNIFDNMYLQNNQRTIAIEGQVNLDDLMVSRPGRIIRAKTANAVIPYVTPPLSGDAYKMMDYLDQVRASRSGVSPEGAVSDSSIGDRVGSQGVDRMMNQKEELVGLMIRVVAETGIKPLCTMIRNLAVEHQDVIQDYKFRGQWVQVKPTDWSERPHTTVRVGTGTGNKKEQQSAITQIMEIQERILAKPGQALVNEAMVFDAVDDFVKLSGIPGASRYLIDPKSPEGKENKEQIQKQQQEKQAKEEQRDNALMQANLKVAQAEEDKVKVSMANAKLKAQNDQMQLEMDGFKQQSSNEVDLLKQQLEEAKSVISADQKDSELEYNYWNSGEKHDIERERIAASEQMAKDNNNE